MSSVIKKIIFYYFIYEKKFFTVRLLRILKEL